MANVAMNDMKNRIVEVKREQLVETLIKNRDAHLENYRLAVEGYRSVAKKELDSAHAKAKRELEDNVARCAKKIDAFDPSDRNVSDYLALVSAVNVHLVAPRNYCKEYDAAIDMAKWDVRETLELTSAEFQCFVRDVWEWSEDFRESTIAYSLR